MSSSKYYDSSHFGWGLLSFFFPFVGLILALVWVNTRPERAHACLVGMLIIMSISIVANGIIYGIALNNILNPKYSGTGPNWNANEYYKPSYEQFTYPSPPNPNNAVYNDSSDGILKFYLTNEDLPTVYDQATNSVIACDKFSCYIYVYNAANGQQLFAKEYPQTIECFAAYGGKLVVAFVNTSSIELINLENFASQQYNAEHYVFSMVVTDDGIIFSGNDYGPGATSRSIFKLTFSNGKSSVILGSVYDPTFDINREKKILYVAERNLSSCGLYYINLKTNYAETKTEFMQYSYSKYELFYDGTYVHAFGNLYDTTRGNIKYQGQSIVKEIVNGTPYSTLCINGNYSLTVTTDCKTAVCNNKNKKVVRVLDLYATRIYNVGNNKYVALCGDSGYYCLIDLNNVL